MSKSPAQPKAPPTWSSPEYIAYCAAQAKRVNIRYADGDGVDWREALLVHTWRRQDPEVQRGPIMSASSGPKDYLCNDVIGLFADDVVDAVSMFVLNGVPFLVSRKGTRIEDVATGRPVHLRWEKKADAGISSEGVE